MTTPVGPWPSGDDDALLVELERSKSLGFLGPGPVGDHVAHAHGLVSVIESVGAVLDARGLDEPGPDEVRSGGHRGLDLGSGGGIPGLVLARELPAWSWVLLDSHERRTAFLASAVERLGLESRVVVRRDRAEDAGRVEGLRASLDLVVARSFGPPAVTAECGSAFLAVGGLLMVSEPPDPDPLRWPVAGLAGLGLQRIATPATPAWAVLQRIEPVSDEWPRRSGRPAKRPLWT